jgi:hypothetical protein
MNSSLFYIEYKPAYPSFPEIIRCSQISTKYGYDGYIFYGDPWQLPYSLDDRKYTKGLRGLKFDNVEGIFEDGYIFCFDNQQSCIRKIVSHHDFSWMHPMLVSASKAAYDAFLKIK